MLKDKTKEKNSVKNKRKLTRSEKKQIAELIRKAKPDIVREKITALMGDLPKIELFARKESPGWDIWGNEVKSSITL